MLLLNGSFSLLYVRTLLVAFVCVVLSACGGGGSGTSAPTSSSIVSSKPVSSVTASTSSDINVSSMASSISSNSISSADSSPFVSSSSIGLNSSAVLSESSSSVSEGAISRSSLSSSSSSSFSSSSSLASSLLSSSSSSYSSVSTEPLQVSAGAAQIVHSKVLVSLQAQVLVEDSGLSYRWEQLQAEPAVVIHNANQASTSFVAPDTNEPLELLFQVTVTAADGEKAQGQVRITVVAADAPQLEIIFPPAAGSFSGEKISVFGRVQVVEGAELASVTVLLDGEPTIADVDEQGNWRADDVPVPEDTDALSIQVRAIDSLQRESVARSLLMLGEEAPAGSGEVALRDPQSILLDEDGRTAWVLVYGSFFIDSMKIIPVDLRTGQRGDSLTNAYVNAREMIYSEDKSQFILAVGPSSGTNSVDVGQIYSLERATGQLQEISGVNKGEGVSLRGAGVGITLNGRGGLYLAENVGGSQAVNRIVEIDMETGDRSVIELTDTADNSSPFYALANIAWDNTSGSLLMLKNAYSDSSLWSFDLANLNTTQVSQGRTFINNNGFIVVAGDKAFTLSWRSRIVEVDLRTGASRLVADDVTQRSNDKKRMAYDATNNLLYVSGGGLYVVDVESGHSVAISR